MIKKHLNRGAIGLLFMFLLSTILPAKQIFAENQLQDEEYVDIIVRYEEEVPEDNTLNSRIKNIQTLDGLPIQTMTVPTSLLKEVSLIENVRRVTYDQEVTTSQSDYAIRDEDWNQEMIGTFDAWQEGFSGEGINVAVLDTGFAEHSDIVYSEGSYSIFGTDDDWIHDYSGHGTHVAGIIGSDKGTRTQGVSPGVNLYGVKVYPTEESNRTSISNLISGLKWAVEDAPNDIDIIVISSGYKNYDPEIHRLIKKASEQDILIIAASGNYSNGWDTIDFPAAHEEVIAVSNVDRDMNSVTDSKSGADDNNSENNLSAPGQNILSLGLNNDHTQMSGTSQAAPHVAGIAALLMEKYPERNVREIKKLMEEQALDLGEPGHDDDYGYGLVQFAEQPVEEEPEEDDPVDEPGEEEADSPEEQPNEDGSSDEESDPESDAETPSEEDNGSEDNDTDSNDDNEVEETDPTDEENTVDEESDSSDEEETADNQDDDDDESEQQSTVWIRPSETNGVATIAEEDIQAVAKNGVLAVSFDASLGHIERISLSDDQVSTLKEKNVTLLVARADLEWGIPTDNLSEGNALITFEPVKQSVTHEELTKGNILTFGIEQDGVPESPLPSEMTYRFFTPEAEFNQDALYRWNETEETWELLGDAYTKGGVVGVTSETPTLAVFNPEELEAARESLTETDETIDDDPEQTDAEPEVTEEENDSAFLDGNSSDLPVVLSSVVVVILSVSGGFYFFGGKPK